MRAVPSIYCFERRPATDITLPAVTTVPRQSATAPVLRCRHCGHVITAPAEAMSVQGRHQHCFSNPHGVEFHIGCFQAAPGVVCTGEASDFWTWFPGYRWRVSVCGQCDWHLGWRFEGEGRFYGLILARLITAAEPGRYGL